MRLTQQDIDTLGARMPPRPGGRNDSQTEGLVARTQMQGEGCEDMMRARRIETQGFGRDLAASADAIRRSQGDEGEAVRLDEVTRITAAMLERVRSAESRLESATQEASDLRLKLEEARDNARRAPLTALPNRRAVEDAFEARSAAGATIFIAMCDVDHFKSVNDRFGHAVGDRVLKAIAETLTRVCAGHLVARYGGEEFAILFCDIGFATALATLEAARTNVARKRYRLRESDAPLGEITFSAGLAAAGGDDFQTAFQRADQLLYAAKTGGRNRIRTD